MFFGYGALLATIMAACLIVIAWRCLDFGSAGKLQKIKATDLEPVALPGGSWRFIVSGDSRNCGDVVMPAIAARSSQFAPSFYWHLGDLRAIYKIDEDMAFEAANHGQVLTCDNYERLAWNDFITNQISPFGNVPFYLGIGNHEVIPPKDKDEDAFKRQFHDWLDLPVLKEQRQKDKEPPQPEPYYHWIQGGVDFIYLDNASGSFSAGQLLWLQHRLNSAKSDPAVKSVVVGMHEALPDSIANSHSMGDKGAGSPGSVSGGKAYDALARFRDESRKPVYVLASHSHFYMENIFDTSKLKANGARPLPGWIVGTAGAVRYPLPLGAPQTAETDLYGYLLATVSQDGTIDFSFQQVYESDVPPWVRQRYPEALVPWCFAHNSQNRDPIAADITSTCAAR
ncbi:MAG: metallophosphoesterase [Candidatus Sulfotelmatobacter sp.]